MELHTTGINSAYIPVIRTGIQSIQSYFKIEGILLFGSLAKNAEKPFEDAISDIDLIILVKDLPSVKDRLLFLRTLPIDPRLRIIFLMPEEVNTLMTSAGWLMDALSSGKILYDPTNILKMLIASFRKKLLEHHITETPLYWDRPINLGEEIDF